MPSPQRIGQYTVVRELGRGGMGAVFEVEDVRGARLALKLIRPDVAIDDEAMQRFLREGQLLARVRHKNVLAVRDLGTSQRGPYLVTDVVEGESLRALSERRRLEPREAATLVCSLAEGVDAIHAQGILHRDIKPENVVVRPDGVPVLLDFGLARELDGNSLTQTGTLLGTPAYMSPEQAGGAKSADLDARSDVYGLGAVLYTLLAGGPPFTGSSLVDILNSVIHKRPAALPREIDSRLRTICLAALAREPEQRPPSAAALQAELREFLEVPARGPGVPLIPALLLAAVALLATLATLVLSGQEPGPGPEASPQPRADPESRTQVTPPPLPKTIAAPRPARPESPAWYRALPATRRPGLPLPRGLRFGEGAGEYVNGKDGSVLVWIPPGRPDLGPPDERRSVQFAEGYYLGKYEVTWAQFLRFCRDTRRKPPQRTLPGTDLHPVENVDYFAVQAYCVWARLRLPGGDEWEYGARGTDSRSFPWGNQQATPQRARLYFPPDPVPRGTLPVGSLPKGASPFGCRDMAGNVFEYTSEPGQKPGHAEGRIARGSAWDSRANFALTFAKALSYIERGRNHRGFRVARSAK